MTCAFVCECVCLCVCVFYCHFLWKAQDKVCFNLDLAAFPNLIYQNFDKKIYREKLTFVFKLVKSYCCSGKENCTYEMF